MHPLQQLHLKMGGGSILRVGLFSGDFNMESADSILKVASLRAAVFLVFEIVRSFVDISNYSLE